MDYKVLGLKLDRPAYTYKDKESELPDEVKTSLRNDRARGRRSSFDQGFLFAELAYLRGEPLRLSHEGGMDPWGRAPLGNRQSEGKRSTKGRRPRPPSLARSAHAPCSEGEAQTTPQGGRQAD